MEKNAGYVYYAHGTDVEETLKRLREEVDKLGGKVRAERYYFMKQPSKFVEDWNPLDHGLPTMGKLVTISNITMKDEHELYNKFRGLHYVGPEKVDLPEPKTVYLDGKKIVVRPAHEHDREKLIEFQQQFRKEDQASPHEITQRIQNGNTLVAELIPEGQDRGEVVGELTSVPSITDRKQELLKSPSSRVKTHSVFGEDEYVVNFVKDTQAPAETAEILMAHKLEDSIKRKVRIMFAVMVPDKTGKVRSESLVQKTGFVYDAMVPEEKKALVFLPVSTKPRILAERIYKMLDAAPEGAGGEALYKKVFDELAKMHGESPQKADKTIEYLERVRNSLDRSAAGTLGKQNGDTEEAHQASHDAVRRVREQEGLRGKELAMQTIRDVAFIPRPMRPMNVCPRLMNHARKELLE